MSENQTAYATQRVTDAMWQEIGAILVERDRPNRMGRHRVDQRRVAEALAYRLATGCAWNGLPRQFGDDSSVHRTVQRWKRLGIYEPIVAVLTAADAKGAAA